MTIRPGSHRAPTLERRAALLAAAIELVAERGIAGVTHREVAARAGLAPSTTSYFYASIDELVHAAVREVLAQLAHRLERLSQRLREGEPGVDEMLELVVPVLLSAPAADVASQFQAYLRAAHDPAWEEDVREVYASIERLVTVVLEAAEVPVAPGLVRSLIAMVDGFQLQRLAGVEQDTLAEDLAAALRSLLAAGAASSGARKRR